MIFDQVLHFVNSFQNYGRLCEIRTKLSVQFVLSSVK